MQIKSSVDKLRGILRKQMRGKVMNKVLTAVMLSQREWVFVYLEAHMRWKPEGAESCLAHLGRQMETQVWFFIIFLKILCMSVGMNVCVCVHMPLTCQFHASRSYGAHAWHFFFSTQLVKHLPLTRRDGSSHMPWFPLDLVFVALLEWPTLLYLPSEW